MSAKKRANKSGPQSRESDEEDIEEDVPEVQDIPQYTENVQIPGKQKVMADKPSTSQKIRKQFRENYGPGPNTGQPIPSGLRKKIKEEKG